MVNLMQLFGQILEASRAADEEFLELLSEGDRAKGGTYEHWSAKDIYAHTNYWYRLEADKVIEWLEGGSIEPIPQFEESNVDCYERFAGSTWDELNRYAKESREKMRSVLEKLDDESLLGPSWGSDDRKMWESVLQRLYSHKISHYAEFYIEKGLQEAAGRLWSRWAELVAPLDPREGWQGRVHYNAACGLALAGDREAALDELRSALKMQPALKLWSRRDTDLAILHGSEDFKKLITTGYWWELLEGDAVTEAIADQFIRTLTMLRTAVETFSEKDWLVGETDYQRPAGLAMHIAQTISTYSSLMPGDRLDHKLMQVPWDNRDSSVFPSRQEFLNFLDRVEERLAWFLSQADFNAEESQFPWTGSTLMSRVLYILRHTQHHLADMAMEQQRRGLRPPDWS